MKTTDISIFHHHKSIIARQNRKNIFFTILAPYSESGVDFNEKLEKLLLKKILLAL